MRFVITGCGRSGTKYVAHLLTAAGIDCGHEDVFNAWPHNRPPANWRDTDLEGDSSFIAAPWAGELSEELTVIHLVRAPLDHVRSAVGMGHVSGRGKPWVQFIDSWIHHTQLPTVPRQATGYWVRWNQLVEPHAHEMWKLHEIGPEHVLSLADRLGVGVDKDRVEDALARTSRRLNHRDRDEAIQLDQLGRIGEQMAEQAERYGIPLEA